MKISITIKELHIHNNGVDVLLEKLAVVEANLKEQIMLAKEDILATVANETQEVLDKIAADRAEIDAAKAALDVKIEEVATAQAALATAQADVTAAQADIAAKAVLIADLQQQLADLIAAGGGISQADAVAIDEAIKNIFNPAPV